MRLSNSLQEGKIQLPFKSAALVNNRFKRPYIVTKLDYPTNGKEHYFKTLEISISGIPVSGYDIKSEDVGFDPEESYTVNVKLKFSQDSRKVDEDIVVLDVECHELRDFELRDYGKFQRDTLEDDLLYVVLTDLEHKLAPLTESPLKEGRVLVELKGYYDQGNWFFRWEGGRVSLQGIDIRTVAALLQKGQVKDAATQPRSQRGKTYMEMATGIQTGTDRLCWIFSSDLPTFKEYAAKIGGIF